MLRRASSLRCMLRRVWFRSAIWCRANCLKFDTKRHSKAYIYRMYLSGKAAFSKETGAMFNRDTRSQIIALPNPQGRDVKWNYSMNDTIYSRCLNIL
jgi:hypothetical protein